MQKIRRLPYLCGLLGFILLFLFWPLIETSAAGLSIDPVSTALSVSPPDTFTALFKLTNGKDEKVGLTLELELPKNWAPLIPPGTVTLAPGESQILTFPIKVPERVRAGTHEVTLKATSEKEGILKRGSIEVDVERSFQVSVEGPSEGKKAIPGEEITYDFFVLNQGNISSAFSISANSLCPVEVSKKELNLVPGERARVRVNQIVPEEFRDRRECPITVAAQSTMQNNVREEFRITTRILPSPPEQLERDLGLQYETAVSFTGTWKPTAGTTRSATIFGHGETSTVESDFYLTTGELFGSDAPLIDGFDFSADLEDYSLQLGDLSWNGGQWFSLSGRGIQVETEQYPLVNLSLVQLEDNQSGVELQLTTEEGQLSLSGLGSGKGASREEAVNFLLLSDRQNGREEFGLEYGAQGNGWAGRTWRNWEEDGSLTRADLEFIDAPFSNYGDSSLEFDFTQTMEGDPLDFWWDFGFDRSWDETGTLRRTDFGLGTGGNFGEDFPNFNVGLRSEFDAGTLNGTTYDEKSSRLSVGLGHDFDQISWDFQFVHKRETKFDSTKLATLTDLSTTLRTEFESLSPEITFEWSKTRDFLEDVVEKESGVVVSGSGESEGFSRSFSMSIRRIDESLNLSASLGSELPGGGYTSIELDKSGEDLTLKLDLEKNFTYTANWWPVKGQVIGSVFLDEDLDGVFDESEPGLSEAILKLDGDLVSTDDDGAFAFPPGEPVTYDLQLVKLPEDYVAMRTMPKALSLKAGKRTRVNIPVAEAAQLSGRVIRLPESSEGQGEGGSNGGERIPSLEEAGEEEPIPDIGLRLVGEDRTYYKETGPGGSFSFRRLRPGNWRLEIDKETLPDRHYPRREKISFQLDRGEDKEMLIVIYQEEREIEWLN